jgi:hypothetical protein
VEAFGILIPLLGFSWGGSHNRPSLSDGSVAALYLFDPWGLHAPILAASPASVEGSFQMGLFFS